MDKRSGGTKNRRSDEGRPQTGRKEFGPRQGGRAADDTRSFGPSKGGRTTKPGKKPDGKPSKAGWTDRPSRPHPRAETPRAPKPAPQAPLLPQNMELQQPDETILMGRNPVREALKAGRQIDKMYLLKGAVEGTSLGDIQYQARERGITIQLVERQRLDQLTANGSHQGVVAQVPAYEYAQLEDVLARAQELGQPPFIVILDGIEDPHNLGAIIRTAECMGVHGVVIAKRRAVGLTATAAKAAAGAAEYVPIVRETNLSRAMDTLKQQGVWIVGADMQAAAFDADPKQLQGPVALVIGGESGGLSRLVREKCDTLLSIPMFGRINSLNASVAAGILMAATAQRRR